MIVYTIAPIDYWNGWQTPSDLFRVSVDPNVPDWHYPEDWAPAWEAAQALARSIGWQGDIAEGPYVTVLPGLTGALPPVAIGWKQESGGVTFIAAPFDLPWMQAGVFHRAVG